MIQGLDHVQLAMPAGEEEAVRTFCTAILGLVEVPKPASLSGRGGAWFALPDGKQLHFGVEAEFTAAQKAHPALVCVDLDTLAAKLSDADLPVKWDDALAPRRRFYTTDPFGNRFEFMAPLSD